VLVSRIEIIPLGGCGEIGKNMTAVRVGDGMIVIDAGLSFPSEEMHGVDVVIPDIEFLRQNRDSIRAIILTHGHEDHIGALSYVLSEISAPVFGTELTIAMANRKLAERLLPHQYDLKVMRPGEAFDVAEFTVEPIHVTHSIPDSCAIALHTELGVVLFTGDFKFDFTPIDGHLTQLSRFGELGDKGVLVLLSDCTNVENDGWCPSEKSVYEGFRRVIGNAPGRVLMTMFSSNLHRVRQAFEVAQEFGRKVALAGRSMETNVKIAQNLDKLKLPKDVMIRLEDVDEYAPEEVVILTTGTQGEPLAALSRMAREEYSRLQIQPGDTVIYAAKPIPGNEAAIWQTVNRLFRQGAVVVYGSEEGVHVSGHGYREELKMMINLTRPQYIAPVHGEPRHQYHYVKLAEEMGYSEENIIVMENGNRLIIEKDGAFFAENVVCGRVLVDTSGYAGVSDETLRDRGNLASDGVLFVHVAIDPDAGKVVGKPELISRGMISPNGELDSLRDVLAAMLDKLDHAELRDTSALHHEISDVARKYIKKATNKRPLVIASVIEV